jgi:hypothetical protein
MGETWGDSPHITWHRVIIARGQIALTVVALPEGLELYNRMMYAYY